MSKYEVKDVVCDYGLYEDGELKLILNSRQNALTIKRILEVDESVPNQATVCNMVEVPTAEFAECIGNISNSIIACLKEIDKDTLIKYITDEIIKIQTTEIVCRSEGLK